MTRFSKVWKKAVFKHFAKAIYGEAKLSKMVDFVDEIDIRNTEEIFPFIFSFRSNKVNSSKTTIGRFLLHICSGIGWVFSKTTECFVKQNQEERGLRRRFWKLIGVEPMTSCLLDRYFNQQIYFVWQKKATLIRQGYTFYYYF